MTYTIFTLSVEKVIKGDPAITEVFIKTLGGAAVTPPFSPKEKILTLLEQGNDNYYTVSKYGVQWFEDTAIGVTSRVHLQDAIGYILQIMKMNNVPISLPRSEWPPLPVGSVSRPK
jgi:hypothetical protein